MDNITLHQVENSWEAARGNSLIDILKYAENFGYLPVRIMQMTNGDNSACIYLENRQRNAVIAYSKGQYQLSMRAGLSIDRNPPKETTLALFTRYVEKDRIERSQKLYTSDNLVDTLIAGVAEGYSPQALVHISNSGTDGCVFLTKGLDEGAIVHKESSYSLHGPLKKSMPERILCWLTR
jgi:hypothetical protein